MTKLQRGLYEQLVTEALEAQLLELDAKHRALRGRLHGEEAADRIALHLGTLIRRVVSGLDSKQRTDVGLELTRQIVQLLDATGKGVDGADTPSPAGDVLQAIAALRPDGTAEHIQLPATPLLDTTLLTNAPG